MVRKHGNAVRAVSVAACHRRHGLDREDTSVERHAQHTGQWGIHGGVARSAVHGCEANNREARVLRHTEARAIGKPVI